MNISLFKKFKILNFLMIIILLAITDSSCQVNDEEVKTKGKIYRSFEGIHDVLIEPYTLNLEKTKVKNIILLIGDGMGTAQVYSGMIANKGHLYITEFPITGFSKTSSSDELITDSAAGATAISTGEKTKNGYVGLNPKKKPLETILEFAEKKGMNTGLISTSAITHATPASFIAHVVSRNFHEDIAASFLQTDIDLFIGGGRNHFISRSDGRNLEDELRLKNYQITSTFEELDSIQSLKVSCLLWEEHGPSILEGRGDMLVQSTKKAIELLSKDNQGFFLMVEGSQIDWGGHQNDTQYLVEEMLDFDKAIGEALKFAIRDGNTLVVITADHETGGFSINGGDIKKGKVMGKFTTDSHTAIMVPVFAFGPYSQNFSGIYENTEIYYKMKSALEH